MYQNVEPVKTTKCNIIIVRDTIGRWENRLIVDIAIIIYKSDNLPPRDYCVSIFTNESRLIRSEKWLRIGK